MLYLLILVLIFLIIMKTISDINLKSNFIVKLPVKYIYKNT